MPFATRATFRKILVLALGALMIGVLAAPAGAAGAFTDDDGNVHEADIDFIAGLGVTEGCNPPTNDHFCPDDFVTRAQMATFLVRAFGIEASAVNAFTDDEGNTHEANINAIAAAGVTLGCNPPANDNYCPANFVTRAQMASFLIRVLTGVKPFEGAVFDDVVMGATHTTNINALAGLGITVGCTSTDYCPNDFVTRAQMASFLARAIKLGDARPPMVSITSPANLATFITAVDPDTGLFVAEVTFIAAASDPNGGTPTFAWKSSVGGDIGAGSPLTRILPIPAGQTSSQPFITVIATDPTGLFSGDKIQIKLILSSP